MATRSQRIPSTEWERHKQTISELYKQKPLKDVKAEMASLHGFEASISQFEAQLKQWGVRKNLKRKEWEALFEQNGNAESDVTASGVAIASNGLVKSHASVKRARRWVEPRQNAEEPFIMRTSSLDSAASVSGPPLQELANEDSQLSREHRLSSQSHPPWGLSRPETTALSPITRGVMQLTADQDVYAFDPTLSELPRNDDSFSSIMFPFSPTNIFNMVGSPNVEFDSHDLGLPVQNIRPFHRGISDQWAVELPFGRLEKLLKDGRTARPLFHMGSTTANAGARFALTSAEQMLWFEQHRHLVINRLGTFLPGEDGTAITSEQALETKTMRLLLFSMINGFAFLDRAKDPIKLFCQQGAWQSMLLYVFKFAPPYISQAIEESLLRFAVETGDGSVMELLLTCRPVNINARIYRRFWHKLTLLGRAIDLEAWDVIQVLIKHGAEIEKIDGMARHSPLDLISRLLSGPRPPSKRNKATTQKLFQTLNILIDAGAKVTNQALSFAINACITTDISMLLAFSIEPSEHHNFFRTHNRAYAMSCIVAVVQRLDDADAARLIRHMIHICEQSGCRSCLHRQLPDVETALINGVKLGKLQVTHLLTDYVPSPRGFLCAAITSGNEELINFVIARGTDFDPPAVPDHSTHSTHPLTYTTTTPLALAVRLGNQRLINDLETAGALDRLDQGGRFEALMAAVIIAGYTPYIERLLMHCYSSKHACRPSYTALSLAITGGNDDLAHTLLDAGASPTIFDLLSEGGESPLAAALKRHDKGLTYAILNSGVRSIGSVAWRAAIDWNDTSIISDLLYLASDELSSTGPVDLVCKACIAKGDMAFLRTILQSIRHLDSSILTRCLGVAIGFEDVSMIKQLLDMGANPYDDRILRALRSQPRNILHLLFGSKRQDQNDVRRLTASELQPVLVNRPENAQILDCLLTMGAVDLETLDYIHGPEMDVDDADDLYDRNDIGCQLKGSLTPLGLAIAGASGRNEPNLRAVEAILEAGSDVNRIARIVSAPVRTPETALLVAVSTGKESVVRLLLKYDADVNGCARICMRRTPLQSATELGHLPIVQLLLEHGADVNAGPALRAGGTALQLAAISGNCNVAKELLQRDAQLDALPSKVDGRWALEGAAEHGRLDMIQFLWNVAENFMFTAPRLTHPYTKVMDIPGFTERQCLRAMKFARGNGHMGCAMLVSELSGIDMGRIDTDEYGAPWLAY